MLKISGKDLRLMTTLSLQSGTLKTNFTQADLGKQNMRLSLSRIVDVGIGLTPTSALMTATIGHLG